MVSAGYMVYTCMVYTYGYILRYTYVYILTYILGILANYEISGKSQNFTEISPGAQSSAQNENFVNIIKNSWKVEIELFP